eukprot:19934-Pleurochrysis_carterae.AAC.1
MHSLNALRASAMRAYAAPLHACDACACTAYVWCWQEAMLHNLNHSNRLLETGDSAVVDNHFVRGFLDCTANLHRVPPATSNIPCEYCGQELLIRGLLIRFSTLHQTRHLLVRSSSSMIWYTKNILPNTAGSLNAQSRA